MHTARVDWLSTDPERPGVFAVGQEACGIFALGQLATGVIAVGQVARGVVAVGQGAVGVVAIGQGALGILYAGGMFAIGGRGFGLVLKVLPKVWLERYERPVLPPLTSLGSLESGERTLGWVLARLEGGALVVDGEPAPLEPSEELKQQLREAVAGEHTHACVTVEAEERMRPDEGGYREAAPRERALVGKRMQSWREAPPRIRLEGALTSPGGLALRALVMVALVVAWWVLAGADVLELLR
jgi:hypothetical protein